MVRLKRQVFVGLEFHDPSGIDMVVALGVSEIRRETQACGSGTS